MLSDKMEKELNKQVNAELESFYVYLSMASYMESVDLLGFAHWMREQADEEMSHAMKIYDYIHERDGRVVLGEIAAPPSQWDGVGAVYKAAYEQEVSISRKIDKIVDLAIKEADHATHSFMQWFVNEQVEEVATVKTIIQKLKLIDGAPGGLFLLDREMGQRPGDSHED
ncbi:MAG TPA: ferritin [Acidobacteriota bacterium]|nr:ferritin [Acidobacteriota bacterium]